MKLIIYTNIPSPHQLPVADELHRALGADGLKYLYQQELSPDRKTMGWSDLGVRDWCCNVSDVDVSELEDCDVLLSGVCDLDLFERRCALGKKTLYMSERWFKPHAISRIFSLPGICRMCSPHYRQHVRRFVRWIRSDVNSRIFAIGPWAMRDFQRIGCPAEKCVEWGYFVQPGASVSLARTKGFPLKILWVGRMLAWKRVDTIIKAVSALEKSRVCVTFVGDGPERKRLEADSAGLPIKFVDSLPIEQIRCVMRRNDIYVLASTAQEGWGAALSEALEEGMYGIGTYEAGASASMLDECCKFHSGDWRRLSELLDDCVRLKKDGNLKGQGIGQWSTDCAVHRLLQEVL